MNRSGPMAMGLYLEAGFNQPLSVDVMEEVAQFAENQTGHRNFVFLCHRPPRLIVRFTAWRGRNDP